MNIINEFLGIGGYKRTPEGAWSWQHLVFTFSMVAIALFLAIFLGIKCKNSKKGQNIAIIVSAIIIDLAEIFHVVILGIRQNDFIQPILLNLPLFLCSLMEIILPLAAICKGRFKEALLDFVLIFGLIAGIMGTVGAAQNYNAYPVLSFDNVVSAIIHCVSAFASLFIGITGMAKLKKENMWISFVILLGLTVLATIANKTIPYNYMFLERDDGTPYSIFFNLVGGNMILYKIIVVGLFALLIAGFYVFKIIWNKKGKKKGN